MECLYGRGLLLACLLIGGQLSITEALLLSLLISLLHELDNQILNHLLDLLEGVSRYTHGKGGEHPAVDSRGLALQVRRHTKLVGVLRIGPELGKGGALHLYQGWELLLGCT